MISSKEAAGVGETLGFFVGGGGWTVGAIPHEPYHCHHVHCGTREPAKAAATPAPGHLAARQSGVRGWRDNRGDEPVLRWHHGVLDGRGKVLDGKQQILSGD